jgi:hypothetical protein
VQSRMALCAREPFRELPPVMRTQAACRGAHRLRIPATETGMNHRIVPTLVPLLLAACTGGPAAPDGALVGRFGGQAAEVNASATVIEVRYSCNSFRAPGPIIPDSVGAFALTLTPTPGNRATSATLIGTTSGDSISFRTRTVFPDFVLEDRGPWIVRRKVSPDYSILSCVLPPR